MSCRAVVPRSISAALAVVLSLGCGKPKEAPKPIAPARPAPRQSIAVVSFAASPDAAGLDAALAEMLAIELFSNEKLREVPRENVARALRDLSIPAGSSDAATLAKLHKSLGADQLVVGSVAASGDVRVDLKVVDVKGRALAAINETGPSAALADLVSRVGASLTGAPSGQDPNARRALPKTTEAARLWAEGLAKLRASDPLSARPLLERAVAADPDFAWAHAALARTLALLGYEAKAREAAEKAIALGGSLPRVHKLALEAEGRVAAGDTRKACEAYQALAHAFPDDPEWGLAAARLQEAAGDGAAALKTVDALRASRGDDPRLDIAEAGAALAAGDVQRSLTLAQRAAAKAGLRGEPTLVAWARLVEGEALRLSGQSTKAVAAFEDVQRTFEVEGDRWGMARAVDGRARVFEGDGSWDEMRSALDEANALREKIGDRAGLARGHARIAASHRAAGDLTEAKKRLTAAAAVTSALGARSADSSLQSSLAEVLADLAQLPAAKKAAETARDEAHAGNDPAAEAAALTALSRADLLGGDVSSGKKNAGVAVALVETRGLPRPLGDALSALGAAQLAAGDANAARATFERASKVWRDAKLEPSRLDSQLDLLAAASAEGRFEDVVKDAPPLVAALAALKRRDGEVRARLLYLEGLLAKNKQGDAEVEIEKALPLAERTENPSLRFAAGLVRARHELAKGFTPAADKAARIVERDAGRFGLAPLVLEARLVLGQIQATKGKTAILADVKKLADERGLGLLALRAEDALLHR